MFETNCSSLHQQFKKKLLFITNKREKKLTFPIFDNEFLSSSKQSKIVPKYCIFPIKHEDMCYNNTECFMSGGLILDSIIMNILSEKMCEMIHQSLKGCFKKLFPGNLLSTKI